MPRRRSWHKKAPETLIGGPKKREVGSRNHPQSITGEPTLVWERGKNAAFFLLFPFVIVVVSGGRTEGDDEIGSFAQSAPGQSVTFGLPPLIARDICASPPSDFFSPPHNPRANSASPDSSYRERWTQLCKTITDAIAFRYPIINSGNFRIVELWTKSHGSEWEKDYLRAYKKDIHNILTSIIPQAQDIEGSIPSIDFHGHKVKSNLIKNLITGLVLSSHQILNTNAVFQKSYGFKIENVSIVGPLRIDSETILQPVRFINTQFFCHHELNGHDDKFYPSKTAISIENARIESFFGIYSNRTAKISTPRPLETKICGNIIIANSQFRDGFRIVGPDYYEPDEQSRRIRAGALIVSKTKFDGDLSLRSVKFDAEEGFGWNSFAEIDRSQISFLTLRNLDSHLFVHIAKNAIGHLSISDSIFRNRMRIAGNKIGNEDLAGSIDVKTSDFPSPVEPDNPSIALPIVSWDAPKDHVLYVNDNVIQGPTQFKFGGLMETVDGKEGYSQPVAEECRVRSCVEFRNNVHHGPMEVWLPLRMPLSEVSFSGSRMLSGLHLRRAKTVGCRTASTPDEIDSDIIPRLNDGWRECDRQTDLATGKNEYNCNQSGYWCQLNHLAISDEELPESIARTTVDLSGATMSMLNWDLPLNGRYRWFGSGFHFDTWSRHKLLWTSDERPTSTDLMSARAGSIPGARASNTDSSAFSIDEFTRWIGAGQDNDDIERTNHNLEIIDNTALNERQLMFLSQFLRDDGYMHQGRILLETAKSRSYKNSHEQNEVLYFVWNFISSIFDVINNLFCFLGICSTLNFIGEFLEYPIIELWGAFGYGVDPWTPLKIWFLVLIIFWIIYEAYSRQRKSWPPDQHALPNETNGPGLADHLQTPMGGLNADRLDASNLADPDTTSETLETTEKASNNSATEENRKPSKYPEKIIPSEVPGFALFDQDHQLKKFNLFFYSLDAMIPFLNLNIYHVYYPVEYRWVPTVQHVIGWVLLGAFIASLAFA